MNGVDVDWEGGTIASVEAWYSEILFYLLVVTFMLEQFCFSSRAAVLNDWQHVESFCKFRCCGRLESARFRVLQSFARFLSVSLVEPFHRGHHRFGMIVELPLNMLTKIWKFTDITAPYKGPKSDQKGT